MGPPAAFVRLARWLAQRRGKRQKPRHRKNERIALLFAKLQVFGPFAFLGGLAFLCSLPSFNTRTEVEEHAFAAGQAHAQLAGGARLASSAKSEDFFDEVESTASLAYVHLEAAVAAEAATGSRAALCFLKESLQPTETPFLFLPREAPVESPSLFGKSARFSRGRQEERGLSGCGVAHLPAFQRELHALFRGFGVEAFVQRFFLKEEQSLSVHANVVAVARSARGEGRDAQLLFFLFDQSDAPSLLHFNSEELLSAADTDKDASFESLKTLLARKLLEAGGVTGEALALTAESFPPSALRRRGTADRRVLLESFPNLDVFASALKTSGLRLSARSAGAAAVATAKLLQEHSPWLSRDVYVVVGDGALPFSAAVRAFLTVYHRPWTADSLPRVGPLRTAAVVEFLSPKTCDEASPASAAASASRRGLSLKTQEETAEAAGRRWSDPSPQLQNRYLRERQEACVRIREAQQEGAGNLFDAEGLAGLLPDFSAFAFMEVGFEGQDGQLANQDIANVVLTEARLEGLPSTLRSFWESVFRPILGVGTHAATAPLLRDGVSAASLRLSPAPPVPSFKRPWRILLSPGACLPAHRQLESATKCRVLERVARSSSNAEVSLFRSFCFYFFASKTSHVSSGTFLYATPVMGLLVGLPLLGSRVLGDARVLLMGTASLSAAVLATLPAYWLATWPAFGERLLGVSVAPRCLRWRALDFLEYSQKASVWLYALLLCYVPLLLLFLWLARRIRSLQLREGEHPSQVAECSAQFAAPTLAKFYEAKKASPQNASAPEKASADSEEAQELLLAEEAEKALDDWRAPRAPPALWLCMRGVCCRLHLFVALVGLVLHNVALSWLLAVSLLPLARLLVPLRGSGFAKARAEARARLEKAEAGVAGEEERREARLALKRLRRRAFLLRLRKAALLAWLFCLVLCFSDFKAFRSLRGQVFRAAHDASAAARTKASAFFGNSGKGSPEALFGWLSSGVLEQSQGMLHQESLFLPESALTSVCVGEACAEGLSEGKEKTQGQAIAASSSPSSWLRAVQIAPWLSREQQIRLLKFLLPSEAEGPLLYLFGQARDAVCVGGNTLGVLAFVVAPFLLCAFAVAFVLPV